MKRLLVLFLGAVAISTACVFPNTATLTPSPSPSSTPQATQTVFPTPTTAFSIVGTPSGTFVSQPIHPATITLQSTESDTTPYILKMTVETGENKETTYTVSDKAGTACFILQIGDVMLVSNSTRQNIVQCELDEEGIPIVKIYGDWEVTTTVDTE